MSWKTVIGQERVKEILRSTLERDRLAHAYLFSGPHGVGKDAAALELAKIVNCEQGPIEACGRCTSCKKAEKLQHPNINLVFALPVGKNEKYGDSPTARLSEDDIAMVQDELRRKAGNPYLKISLPRANTIKINSIREIRKESSLSISEHGRKVFILLDAENLSEESSNALLKSLEEPQGHTLFILTTSQPERLLPTIISRCQQVRFGLLTAGELSDALQERERVDPAKSDLIAQVARGSYTRALDLKETGVESYYADAVKFLRTVLYRSRQDILGEIDRICSENERPEVEEFLVVLQSWFHTAMLLAERSSNTSVGGDGETIRKFVEHHRSLDYGTLLGMTERAISLLNKNVYIPLILVNLALQLKENIVSSNVQQH
jgi:DNA polymerase III subunit delta'